MAKKMTLYGERLSPFVERVHLQIQLKDLSRHFDYQGLVWGEFQTPEYLAINPIGKMPALTCDGLILYESFVIMEYLEEIFPEKPLLPEEPEITARVRLLIHMLDLYYHPNILVLMLQYLKTKEDQEIIDRHLQGLEKVLGYLENFISSDEHAVGERMTLADTTLFISCFFGMYLCNHYGKDFFEQCPKLKAWYDKAGTIPPFKESNQTRSRDMKEFMADVPEIYW